MKRDDLRVHGGTVQSWAPYGFRPVSDAELAELIESMGYVKTSYPENMTLTDWQALLAEAAENVAREWMEKDGGWVKRPVCGECVDGDYAGLPCPSCGGTGYGRLVALDGIDVEAIEDALADIASGLHLSDDQLTQLVSLASTVLAIRREVAELDKENTP